jgi:hypothetical protein
LPPERLCLDCHDVDKAWADPASAKPAAECSTCHAGGYRADSRK